MEKKFRLEGLCCADCSAKLEKLIANIEGVLESKIIFVTQKLKVIIDEANSETIIEKIAKTVDDFGEGEISFKEII